MRQDDRRERRYDEPRGGRRDEGRRYDEPRGGRDDRYRY
jgi:hypothetical protein